MNTQPVGTPPSLADQIAFVDAVKVASLICAKGPRSAIQASTVDIIAMAQRLLRLSDLADLTYELLAATDTLPPPGPALDAVKRLASEKISVIGASLEALGYGQQCQPVQQEENNDGQG